MGQVVNLRFRTQQRQPVKAPLHWRHNGRNGVSNHQIVCSTVFSCVDELMHQSSVSLAFVRGIHRGPVNSPHKWLVMRRMFHLMTSSCETQLQTILVGNVSTIQGRSIKTSSIQWEKKPKWTQRPYKQNLYRLPLLLYWCSHWVSHLNC